MEIFYTGQGERRLLAVFHPGATEKLHETAVIICHPLGHEYIRYYKTLSVLAKKLSAEGFSTLRFDYFGTGDSYGNEEDLTIDTARHDLEQMVNEVKDATGFSRICLIGVRFGTLICSSVLHIPGICAVALWNPVLSGALYLEDLSRQHKLGMDGSFAKSRPGDHFEALGFAYNDRFAHPEVTTLTVPSLVPTFILADNGFWDRGKNLHPDQYPLLTRDTNEESEFWIKPKGDRDKSMVPVSDLEKIIRWMKGSVVSKNKFS